MTKPHNYVGRVNIEGDSFFRLYGGQALDPRAPLEQNGDPKHRKRYPSLQYDIIDACNRLLQISCCGQFPAALLEANPEILSILLNIVEKLGSFVFQNHPAATLERYSPNHNKPVYPNVHLDYHHCSRTGAVPLLKGISRKNWDT